MHCRQARTTLCLEVGCGTGYVITSVALMLQGAAACFATDLNPAAAATTAQTLRQHGAHAQASPRRLLRTLCTLRARQRWRHARFACDAVASASQVVVTDLVHGLEARLAGKVDLLVFNPPYVPSPPEEARRCGARTGAAGADAGASQVGGARLSAAWAGGARGRTVLDRLLPQVGRASRRVRRRAAKAASLTLHVIAPQIPALLSPTGALYLVAVSDNDVPDLLRCLAALGLYGRVCLVRTADEEKLHIIAARRTQAP